MSRVIIGKASTVYWRQQSVL